MSSLGIGLSLPELISRGGGVIIPFIKLSNKSQDEGTDIGTTIGTLSVVGGSGVYTFAKTVDGDSAFTLTGATLKNAIVFDYETKTSHAATFTADNGVDPVLTATITVLIGNIAAPVLSNATGTETGSSTADLSVDTTGADGTLYVVVTESATVPSSDQVAAGTDENDAAAAFDDSQVISSIGTKTFSATGLSGSTDYYAHFMHEGLPSEQSNVISSIMFTTESAGGINAGAFYQLLFAA